MPIQGFKSITLSDDDYEVLKFVAEREDCRTLTETIRVLLRDWKRSNLEKPSELRSKGQSGNGPTRILTGARSVLTGSFCGLPYEIMITDDGEFEDVVEGRSLS